MDRRMANDLDNHITGHYGEDQFTGPENPDLKWRIGDIWNSPGQESYILARMNDPHDTGVFYTQFIGLESGNRYSEKVLVRDGSQKDITNFTIEEICELIFGYNVAGSTTDDDNVRLDNLENQHQYGKNWE